MKIDHLHHIQKLKNGLKDKIEMSGLKSLNCKKTQAINFGHWS